MVLNQLYRFIAIAVLGIMGCTASGSPGQLTENCISTCNQYSGSQYSVCYQACNDPDNSQTGDCSTPCLDAGCYNKHNQNPNGCQTDLITNQLYCVEICLACTTGCLAAADSGASTAPCFSLTQQMCNGN